MRQLWSGWPWQVRAKSGTLALALGENSIRYVFATATSEQKANVNAWGTVQRGTNGREAFMKRVKLALPPAARTIAVLDPRDYQILQLEAANVPAEEQRDAVRWKAVEYLDGPPQDYTFDVLPMTSEAARGNIIAVAARNDLVRSQMIDCAELGYPLSVIDVVETAQRNLLRAALQGQPSTLKVAAALVADSGRALFIVAARGELCFFRRFDFDVDTLAVPVDKVQAALMSQGASAETAARSMMQLNRSLDLWDHSCPDLPIDVILVDAGAKTGAIIDRIKPEAGIEMRPLDLSKVFKLSSTSQPAPWQESAYLPLLGALLRSPEPGAISS